MELGYLVQLNGFSGARLRFSSFFPTAAPGSFQSKADHSAEGRGMKDEDKVL